MVEYLLERHPEFEILSITPYDGFAHGIPELTKSKDEAYKRTVRIFPHKMKGEGHFLALLRKRNIRETDLAKSVNEDSSAGRGRKKLPQELEEFFRGITWKLDADRLEIHGERVYYMPCSLPDVRGIRFLRTGLLLGELKKNRFEPSQALAMCLKKEEYGKVLNLKAEDVRISRYLKGETLEVSDVLPETSNGWYLVCVDGYPLGWGKLTRGTMKNKYLPGWRLC